MLLLDDTLFGDPAERLIRYDYYAAQALRSAGVPLHAPGIPDRGPMTPTGNLGFMEHRLMAGFDAEPVADNKFVACVVVVASECQHKAGPQNQDLLSGRMGVWLK
jgi:hypothetical protein